MEGWLQSLKERDPEKQKEICALSGIGAKRRGRKLNKAWQADQTLWWRGKAYDRHDKKYQRLLDRAYHALSRNPDFQKALLATGNEPLTHSIGSTDPHFTVLTEQEFCKRLLRLRAKLQREQR